MFGWSYADKKVLPIALLVVINLALITCLIFRKKSDRVKDIPLIVIALAMLVMEVFKQIISIRNGYDLWHAPLHFCSLFLYWFPLMAFFKDGKIKRFGITMSFASAISVMICFYISPGGILGTNNTANVFKDFFSAHAFIYHHLIFLYLLIGLMLDKFKIDKTCFIHIFIGISLYGAVALYFAYSLNTNYCNLLVCIIDFVENWRLMFGQAWYIIGVYAFGISLCCLVCAIKLFIQKIKIRHIR